MPTPRSQLQFKEVWLRNHPLPSITFFQQHKTHIFHIPLFISNLLKNLLYITFMTRQLSVILHLHRLVFPSQRYRLPQAVKYRANALYDERIYGKPSTNLRFGYSVKTSPTELDGFDKRERIITGVPDALNKAQRHG